MAIRTIGLKKGTYTITTTYNGISQSNTLKIKDTSTTRKNTSLTLINSTNGNYTLCLKDQNNNVLAKKSILLKFNTTSFNLLTNSEGMVKLTSLLPEGDYTYNITFPGDNYYYLSNIADNIQINKRNTILDYTNMNLTLLGKNTIDFYLKDEFGNILTNESLDVTIGNAQYQITTDNSGHTTLSVDLSEGNYTVNATYNGNQYYQNSNTITTDLTVDSYPFSYTILIPNYINLTNDYWTVYDNIYTHNFIGQTGPHGIIHMPVVRNFSLLLNNNEYHEYLIGHVASSDYSISYGEYRDFNCDDFTVHVESDIFYTNVTYYGFVKGGVSQFSAVYPQMNLMGHYQDFEEVLLMVNGENKVSIGFGKAFWWNEDGVKFAFMENNTIHASEVLSYPYSHFTSYQNLTFADTGESVVYSSDLTSIVNLPTKERIGTVFSFNNESIVKDEWVSFCEYFNNCGIELVQSYAIADCLVNDTIMDYFLDLSDLFVYFTSETAYCNFLTGLSCIWMFDESSSKLGELSNVSINRDGCGVVLSGVDFDHNAYMHTTDPILGLKFNGNNTNDTYICQAIASLLLGEIESKALGLTGRESKSSLNTILTEILNGRNYTIILNNETLTIKLEENENCTWLYDINSGLIYDLSNYNNFTYKGAISTNITTNCPFLFSEILYNNFDKELNIEFSDRDKKEIAKIGAAASLTLASATIPSIISTLPIIFAGVATAPVWMPLIVGTSLVLLGYALYLYANDGNYQNAIGDTFTDLVFNMVV